MNHSFNVGLPLLIILIGVGYLLANLGMIPITPLQALIRYWPVFLILWGVRIVWDALFSRFRGQKSSSLILGIVLILGGLNLVLRRSGYPGFSLNWGIVWPILVIVLGLELMLKSKRGSGSSSPIIGDFSRSGEAWYVEDLYLNHFIGDVKLDLTKAVVPNKEIFFDINGSIGDITIYIPHDLPLNVKSNIGIGEIRVLDHGAEGIARSLELRTPDYDEAERKLNLRVFLKIGEITVRRIG